MIYLASWFSGFGEAEQGNHLTCPASEARPLENAFIPPL